MVWTDRLKSSTSFTNRPNQSGYMTVGEMGLDHPLFAGLSFDDPVPGTTKTLGELTFDDLIRASIWSERTELAASFTNRPKSA